MAPKQRGEQKALTERFGDALRAEARASERRGAQVSAVALVVVSGWLLVEIPFPDVLYYLALMAGFVVLFVGPGLLTAAGHPLTWERYLLPVLIGGLLTFAIYYPNPLSELENVVPPGWRLHFNNEVYYFIGIAFAGFRYSRGQALWAGVATAACYVGGVVWLATANGIPITFTQQEMFSAMTPADATTYITDPGRIEGNDLIK